MPTPNLNLPTITPSMSADVPRDMNALAYALDEVIGDKKLLATQNKNNLVAAMNEVFQASSDKNTKIAAAITEMGVPTSPQATGDQMATNIKSIFTGFPKEYGTILPSTVTDMFSYADLSSSVNSRFIEIELNFEPDVIYVYSVNNDIVYTSLVHRASEVQGWPSFSTKVSPYNGEGVTSTGTHLLTKMISGAPKYKFRIPVWFSDTTFSWKAFG